MASDALMISGEAIAINGEAVASSTFPVPCCCGGCLYYKAVRCNQVCGIPTPSAVYVCKDTLCTCPASYTQCPPCNRPIEAGMFVRYGIYCYKIQTDVVYCSQFSAKLVSFLAGRSGGQDGCVPLPQGAEVVPPGTIVDCCKTCLPTNGCPEIQGWFPMVPCQCGSSQTSTNCVAYVSCHAYFSSLSTSNCPVWMVNCQTPGETRCMTVRPDATPVPDPPPGAILITTRAPYRNCCQCCGSGGLGCCFDLFIPRTTTWSGCNPPVVVEGLPQECCRVAAHTTYSGSCITKVYIRWPGTESRCLRSLVISKVEGNEVVTETHRYNDFLTGPPTFTCAYPVEASGYPTIERFPISPCTNATALLGLLVGNGTTGGECPYTGTLFQGCATASISFSNVGNPSLTESTQSGFASVSSAEGCGNMNCQPGGGGFDAPPITVPTGCSGCGREGL